MAFELKRSSRSQDKKVLQKVKNKAQSISTVKVGKDSIVATIANIKAMVEKHLGKYKDEYIVITDIDVLKDYIDACIKNKYISIDTETDGLDPLQNTLAGICIYTYTQKGAYIPLNHISYVTNLKSEGQLPMEDVINEFHRLLKHNPKIDMFNAKFDIRFLRASGLKEIYCTWDGYLASQLLNENEPTHGLKPLHQKYVLNGQGDAWSFGSLFNGIPFTLVPYNVGYLYAARDPVITTELCDYQRPFLTAESDKCKKHNLQDVAWVFHNIEMPCIKVVADMEDNGVTFDMKYCQQLSEKYNKLLEEKKDKFYELCDMYKKEIDTYKSKHSDNKLDNPINIGSPTQIAILIYDVLKEKPVLKDKPRGTGEEVLQKIGTPICKAILEYREVNKLITTYIDKMPGCVNPKDGKVHCSFNQYGARTGRFSSSDPNLQNIPSRNHDIRKMFIATHEETIVNFDTDDFLEVDKFTEIFINDEWVPVSRFGVGDTIDIYGELFTISNIEESDEKVRIYL